MSKIYLSPSNQYANIGKGDYGTEKDRMVELALLIKDKLVKKFEVKLANFDSNLSSRATESNNWGSDIYIALHSNAGGGKGCEIYAYSTQSKGNILAQKVYNQIANITPSSDRGIKYNELYETRVPIAPSILIEAIFHDSIDDVNWYLANIDNMATAIAKGIYEYFGITYEESKPVEPVKPILEIKDIENKKIKLKIDAYLWDLNFTNYNNVKSIKQFKAGDIMEVSAIAKHMLGGNYYLTEYSYSKGINNGFNVNDCEDYIEPIIEEPKEENKPIEPPIIVQIPEEKISLSLFQIIINFIKEIFKYKSKK